MDIKRRFPDDESVKNEVAQRLDDLVSSVKTAVGPLEAHYIEKSKRRARGQQLIGAGFVILLVAIESTEHFAEIIGLLFLGMIVGVVLMVYGWRQTKGTKAVIEAFHEGVNDALYPLVFGVFGLSGQRIPHQEPEGNKKDDSFWKTVQRVNGAQSLEHASPQSKSALALLDHSELVTEPRNRVSVDDLAVTKVHGRDLFLAEFDIKHVTGSGKNQRTKKIFHGYFVSYDLSRTLQGKTFVSTEGDTKGFGHKSFFNSFKSDAVKETVLEWNDFEELLHVASDNPVEARYVLTPDFMATLYDWWQGKKANIRIAFLANRMYLLFPDKGIRVGKTIKRIERREVAEYIESVAIPLLHVLHLIEEVER